MKTLMMAAFGVVMMTAGAANALAQDTNADRVGDRDGYRHDDRPVDRRPNDRRDDRTVDRRPTDRRDDRPIDRRPSDRRDDRPIDRRDDRPIDRRDDRPIYHDDRAIYRHDDRFIVRDDPRFEFIVAAPISFEVVRSREIVRPCGELCGYRGGDRPAEGVFRIETRFYTEFRGGRVLRTWTEDFEVFLHCYDRYPRHEGPGW